MQKFIALVLTIYGFPLLAGAQTQVNIAVGEEGLGIEEVEALPSAGDPANTNVSLFVQPELATDNELVRVIVTGAVNCNVPVLSRVEVEREEIKILATTMPSGPPCLQPVEFALVADVGPLRPSDYRVTVGIVEVTPTDVISLFFGERSLEVVRGSDTVRFHERFDATIDWVDFEGNTGIGRIVPGHNESESSALFWFFGPDNWEVLLKVLDACSFNGYWWVFGASATNVEYTLRVTDLESGAVSEYFNPLGNAASAITDVLAFPCE